MARAMKDSGIEWIGEIPVGWETVRFKYLHDGLNTGEAIDKEFWTNEESGKPFYTAGLVPIKTSYKDFPPSKYTSDNDLLLARNGTPYVYFPVSGACYTDHIIRAAIKPKMNRRFIQYAVQQSIMSIVVDSVSIATWSASLWNEQAIPWPTVEAQQRIVDFLDTECARIDAVIEQTRASIEEYKKLKQSVITQAVTKGIRLGRKMKDSGVEWIGEIPEDWRFTKTLNCLSMPITDGPHTTPELFDEGIAFISAEAVSCGNGRIDFSHKRGYISQEFYEECCKKYIPEIDDIYMIKSGATTGRVSIVDTLEPTFTIWSPLAVFRCNREMMAPRFLYYALQSKGFQKQVEFGWTFGTQQNIGMRTLEQLKVCVPQVEEQKEIAEYLDKKCAEIDSLIHKKQQFLAELESYKKSLIFEYVTGKRMVT